jgi:hypothetical protein
MINARAMSAWGQGELFFIEQPILNDATELFRTTSVAHNFAHRGVLS